MKYVCVAAFLILSSLLSAEDVNFNRDIKPILSDRCFHCHGPDDEGREGHLRLDVSEGKEGAYRTRKNKSAIVPGDPAKSHVFLRIMTDDEDDVMPPPDSNKKALTAKEKELFKQWITQGAKFDGHWAFKKPVKPSLPAVKNKKWVKNPIDSFILAGIEKKGLQPSPEAPRYKLIRRLSYDLTGLPPAPAEVNAFVNDNSPDAYEKLVDRMLAKPSYGERMALPWLDMARYGDSSVYHADGPRTMWPWRDWVINAYNENKPFDQFTIEQLAGDHIKDRSIEQLIATAFLRNNGTTDEGGAFFEEYRVEYTVDRLVTMSKIWLGLTTECGQCHDHKYDPFTQTEFYELYAFFNIAADPGKQTRRGNQAPVAKVPLPKSRLMLVNILEKEIEDLKKKKETHKTVKKSEMMKWLQAKIKANKTPLDANGLRHYFPLDSQYSVDDFVDTQFAAKPHGDINQIRETNGRVIKKDPKNKKEKGLQTKSAQFNGRTFLSYGQKGNWICSDTPFSAAFWIKYEPKNNQFVFGKSDKKAKMKGYSLTLNDQKIILTLTAEGKKILKVESPKVLKKQWQYVTVTYDGSKKAAGVKMYLDGKQVIAKALSDKLEGTLKNKGLFQVAGFEKQKLRSPMTQLKIYDRVLKEAEILKAKTVPAEAGLYTEENTKKAGVLSKIENYYFMKVDKNYRNFDKQIAAKKKNIDQNRNLNVMVMEDQKNPRKTYILNRGAYDQPINDKEILPDTPNILHPMKKEYPKNRLGLAKWIMDDDNPLTARVTVNRYWMMLFGYGLVDTVADFGNQGAWPTHPKLLDWLAVDFRENGWNIKRTLKQIVMSNTYRQDSKLNSKLLAIDKTNKIYARGPRFRLTGEHIRDTALFVSGLLNPEIGGESVRPFQPPGLWAEVALGGARFVQDKGDKNFRKSMYTYYKRSAPIPNMTTFDAPTREKCTIQRSRTNTPLQALITLNDPIFVEAARFFAERIMNEGGNSIDQKIEFAFMSATSRKPESDVRDAVKSLYSRQLAGFKKDPAKSKALLEVGSKKRNETLDLSEHAAWTVIAQLVLNLDETLNKE